MDRSAGRRATLSFVGDVLGDSSRSQLRHQSEFDSVLRSGRLPSANSAGASATVPLVQQELPQTAIAEADGDGGQSHHRSVLEAIYRHAGNRCIDDHNAAERLRQSRRLVPTDQRPR